MRHPFFEAKIRWAHGLNDFLFNRCRFPGSRKMGRTISSLLLPPLKETVKVSTKYKFDLYVTPNGGQEVYNLGFYETGTLHVIAKCLTKGNHFIDVGASIGLMSVFAGRLTKEGKVLSFEPQKERFEVLKKNIELNGCHNIQPFNNGLAEKPGKAKLFTDYFSPSVVDDLNHQSRYEEINMLTLDDVLKMEKIQQVRFIKIDVEGFEMNVLKGGQHLLSGKNPPIVCVEYVRRLQQMNNPETSLFHFLKNVNQYRIFQLEKTSSTVSKLIEKHDEKSLKDCDNLYCFMDSHLNELSSKELFH